MACVSVLVLTCNRRPLLERCLAALRGQSRPPDEVLVLDNGSTDGTDALLARLAAEWPMLRVVAGPEEGSYAEARNAAVAASTGELIAFLDDDCEADRHWLARLVAALEDNRWDAAGGMVLPAAELHAPDGVGPEVLWAAGLMGEGLLGHLGGRLHLPSTSNLAFRRRAWEAHPFQELGGQRGDYGTGREDASWWRSLRRAGRPMGIAGRAIVWHHVPESRLAPGELLDRAAADGRAAWRRDRCTAAAPAAARDVVGWRVGALHDAWSHGIPLREAWFARKLWGRRQAEYLAAAVDDYGPDSLDPARRRNLVLGAVGHLLWSGFKLVGREFLVTLARAIRARVCPVENFDNPRHLLVVLHDFLGDAVLALPALAQLRAGLGPHTRITLLTGPTAGPLLADNLPDGIRLEILSPRRTRAADPRALHRLWRDLADLEPDAILLLYAHGLPLLPFFCLPAPVAGWTSDNGIGQRLWARLIDVPVAKPLHQTEVAAQLGLLQVVGVRGRMERPRLNPGAAARARAARILDEAGTRPGRHVVVHFEAGDRYKDWPADRMATVVRRLAERGLTVFLVGSRRGRPAAEREGLLSGGLPGVVSLHGALDGAELSALLVGARLFVGPDSGPAHVAQSVGAPTLVLFGMIAEHRWAPLPRWRGEPGPWGPAATVSATMGDLLEEELVGLPANHGLQLLSVEAVWGAVEALLEGREILPDGDETH